MGTSFLATHGNALDRMEAAFLRAGGGQNYIQAPSDGPRYFVEGPRGHHDYNNTMSLPVYKQVAGVDYCHKVGYVKIDRDGNLTMPHALRAILGKF